MDRCKPCSKVPIRQSALNIAIYLHLCSREYAPATLSSMADLDARAHVFWGVDMEGDLQSMVDNRSWIDISDCWISI